MTVPKRTVTGKLGEILAALFLQRRGYRILERNYRCPVGEMDLVAEHEGALVFIEVRTKSSEIFGVPLESIGLQKQAKLRAVAVHYLFERPVMSHNVRFDAVGILLKEGVEPVIDLVQGAFSRGEFR